MKEDYQIIYDKIPQRKPILNSLPENIDFQWWILSKAILENIKKSPELRKQILSIPQEKLWERLSYNFLNSNLDFNKTVEKLKKRYNDELIKILSLEEIPKDEIYIDISNTREMYKAEETIKKIIEDDYLPFLKDKEQNHYTSKEEKIYAEINNWSFTNWITKEEKKLLIKRYIYARETNILLLWSSILETKKNLLQEEIELENWIKIKNNLDFKNDLKNIFNIKNWWSRKKIKDRVFEVNINWKFYILKERKTKNHTDTLKSWHKDWLTSLEEFEIAKKLYKEWSKNDWLIKIDFEKPITSVLFPNWYQFTLFEKNNIFDNLNTSKDLLSEILNNPEQFQKEYEYVLENYKKYFNNEEVLYLSEFYKNSTITKLLNKLLRKSKDETDLTYLDFSYLMNRFINEKIYNSYEKVFKELWYTNIDVSPNKEVIVKSNEEWITIDIFWYDFEYVKERESDFKDTKIKFWDDEYNDEIRIKLSSIIYNNDIIQASPVKYFSAFLALEELKE